jgi:hypothetical protein
MKFFCTASSDSYITDKIIDGKFRVEDANVGQAGTLDLFKLWGETTLKGTGSLNELSRLLVKFDYQNIHNLTASKINLRGADFKAELRLFDIKAGNAVPANFNVAVFPLSQSFDEGVGKDVGSFGDLDTVNFLTASYVNGANVVWNLSGADKVGSLGTTGLDIFSQANFSDGNGLANIIGSQVFTKGTEDLLIDVTTLVSATVAGQMPNHGFRISFSGSDETDSKSRFVKRFASRHVADSQLRPRIEVSFDDSFQDNHSNFFFDLSGSLFLNAYARSGAAHLVSGSALTAITGTDSLFLKIKSGSFEYITSASQYSAGTIDSAGERFVTGVYSASFAIPSNDSTVINFATTLAQMVERTGSIVFDEYWYSLDGNVGFHTGSLKLKRPPRFSADFTSQEPVIHVTNARSEYRITDEVRLRIFGRDLSDEQNTPVKRPIKLAPIIFDEVYYRVKDVDSGRLIFNFGEADNSTRVSTDSAGMFFDFHVDILPVGRVYEFEFLVVNRGIRTITKDPRARFVVR